MADLPLNDRLTGPFIATAGQTDFPADFPLLILPGDDPEAGISLRVVSPSRDDAILMGEAFSIPDQAENGFTVRLHEPMAGGERVWIVGQLAAARRRALVKGGAIRTAVLEADAEETTARQQELARDRARALSVPFGEEAKALPMAARRRETLLGFNALGDPVALPVVQVLNEIGLTFEDDGAWGAQSDPLTYDDGAFA